MKRRMLRYIIAAAGVAALAALSAFGYAAWSAWRARDAALSAPAAAALTPETLERPGDAAHAVLEFSLPWGNEVVAAEARPGAGTVLSGPVRTTSRIRWGRRLWRVEAALRPLDSHDGKPGELKMTLRRPVPGTDRDGGFAAAIPELRVKKRTAVLPAEPRYADPEALAKRNAKHRKWWFAAAALSAVAAALLLLLLRRKRRGAAAPPPPWDAARAELDTLRRDLARRNFRAEAGVWKLSDILRAYIAARFELPAAAETTEEFLAESCSKLPAAPEDREFLQRFFADAELVKFARVPADREGLERDIDAADGLIDRTVPPPEPPGENGKPNAGEDKK